MPRISFIVPVRDDVKELKSTFDSRSPTRVAVLRKLVAREETNTISQRYHSANTPLMARRDGGWWKVFRLFANLSAAAPKGTGRRGKQRVGGHVKRDQPSHGTS